MFFTPEFELIIIFVISMFFALNFNPPSPVFAVQRNYTGALDLLRRVAAAGVAPNAWLITTALAACDVAGGSRCTDFSLN